MRGISNSGDPPPLHSFARRAGQCSTGRVHGMRTLATSSAAHAPYPGAKRDNGEHLGADAAAQHEGRHADGREQNRQPNQVTRRLEAP